MSITKASLIDLNGQELILDADADTSITADTDDQIDIKIAGSDVITLTSSAITSSAAATITVTDNSDVLHLKSTDDDSSVGPVLLLNRVSSSPADGDDIGAIDFDGRNDAGQAVEYASIEASITDASDGTEDGSLSFRTILGGADTARINLIPGATVVNESGSGSLDFRIESGSQANLFVVNAGDDDIGIGLANPTFASGNGMHFADNFKAGFGTGNGTRPDFQISGDNNGLAIACGTGADTADVLINTSGQVGIGTDNPTRLLHLKQDDTTTYAGNSAGTNIALHLANTSTGAAGNTIGIGLSSESNAEVYLNCVTSANNDGGDFVIASRYGGRSEKMRVLGAGGITFNGDTAAANALDDYEESSFNTELVGVTSGTHTTSGSGRMTKIGRLASVLLAADNVGSGDVSGDLRINLPIAYAGHDMYLPVQVYYLNYPADTKTAYAYVSNGYTYVLLYWSRDNNTSLAINNSDLKSGGGSYIRANFNYPTS